MTRCEKSLFISFVLAVGLVSVQTRTAKAQAQGATATLTGQVTERTGAVLPGAEVAITAPTKNGRQGRHHLERRGILQIFVSGSHQL